MTGHIFIEGEIGTETTVKSVRADIANYPQAKNWVVHINSPGGDVYEGYQIGAILKSLGNTTAQIGAMCASIATYDACSCDKVVMNSHGDFMIHLPTGTVTGTKDDMMRAAAQLDRIKNELIDQYMTRCKLSREQLSGMIDKETSMSPQQAHEYGFVDEVQDKLKAVAKFDITKFQMETLTKKEAEGLFEKLGEKIDKFFATDKGKKKFKNEVQIPLEDGTQVTSDAASADALQGSNIVGQDGNPLKDGDYETADGYKITVQGGVVTAYAPLGGDDPTQALKDEIEALKKQLADSANQNKAAVQARIESEKKFKAMADELKNELEQIKNKTFGDTKKPDLSTKFMAQDEEDQRVYDPMNELSEAYITSHPNSPLIKK